MSFYPVTAISATKPILERESLLRGESTRFHFMIDASSYPLSCSYSTSGLDPLVINFDEQKVDMNAGESKTIYGTLSVPADAPLKTYDGMFNINCEPLSAGGGSKIVQTVTAYFPSVSVVEKAPTTIPIEEKAPATSYSSTIFILIIVIIVIIIGYFFKKEKKKK